MDKQGSTVSVFQYYMEPVAEMTKQPRDHEDKVGADSVPLASPMERTSSFGRLASPLERISSLDRCS